MKTRLRCIPSHYTIGASWCKKLLSNYLMLQRLPIGSLMVAQKAQQPIGGQESLRMGRRQLSEANVAAGGALPILPASPCTLVSRSSIRGVRGRGCPTILTFLSSLAIHPLFLQFAGFSTDFLHQSSNSDQ